MARADKILAQIVAEKLSSLPEAKSEALIKGLEAIDYEISRDGSQHGSVKYSPDILPQLVMEALHAGPYSRIVLRHELSHYIRIHGGHSDSQMAFNEAEKRLNRPNGLLREEARALSDEYDFVHLLWKVEDIGRLTSMVHHEPADSIQMLRQAGMMNGDGRLMFGKQFSKLSDSEKLKLMPHVREWMDYQQRIFFVDTVKEVLLTSKSQFVKHRLRLYRPEQAHRNITSWAKKYFPGGFVRVLDVLGVFELISRISISK
ncbi:MAG: hypothetical protein IPJ71_02470 [Bdellovibrionales bacterium]|nr:hypothetical protein [Bdellovibrionales bacterium]